MQENLVAKMMGEMIPYGGFAVRRIDVYRDLVQIGARRDIADMIAFSPPALDDEGVARLLPWPSEPSTAERGQ